MDVWPGEDDDEAFEESGVRRSIEISATLDGHTHVYRFAPEDADRAIEVVKEHAVDGRFHIYAGLVLAKLIREAEREFRS